MEPARGGSEKLEAIFPLPKIDTENGTWQKPVRSDVELIMIQVAAQCSGLSTLPGVG